MGFVKSFLYLILVFLTLASCAQKPVSVSNCEAPNHQLWTDLLQQNVNNDGWVSYRGFVEDSVRLNQYLSQLADCPPASNWSKSDKLAYWINVYNAFTIKLIVNHYPVQSIKDIKKGIPFVNSVWEMDFFEIGGESFNLSRVEHQILRKQFSEPRIHFAIVCASKSCPQLLNVAFESELLEDQLTMQTRQFLSDSTKNIVSYKSLQLSPIFKWFKRDFTDGNSLQSFVDTYTDTQVSPNAKVKYLNYDWSLNGE